MQRQQPAVPGGAFAPFRRLVAVAVAVMPLVVERHRARAAELKQVAQRAGQRLDLRLESVFIAGDCFADGARARVYLPQPQCPARRRRICW